MSDDRDQQDNPEKKKPSGGVRRVGKDSQKDKLTSPELSFPVDAASEDTAKGAPAAPPDKPAPKRRPVQKPQQPPGQRRQSQPVSPEDLRYAPKKPQPPRKKSGKKPPPDVPQMIDEEMETNRFTPQDERFPPAFIPRELPPEIEQSPHLYPPPPPKKETDEAAIARERQMNRLANTGLTFMGLIFIVFVGYVLFIWRNPYSPVNLFPPPTPLPIIITATFLPPTETTAPTGVPTATFTPLPESALNPQAGSNPTSSLSIGFDVTPTLPGAGQIVGDTVVTPTPLGGQAVTAVTNSGDFAFVVSEPGILYTPNGNGRGCEWSSIAGIIVDLEGEPRNGLGIKIIDQTSGEENTVFSGSAPTFGEGGFQLPFGIPPEQNSYTVQVLSPAGLPLSDAVAVVTSNRCDQNVALVNFEQVKPY